MPRDPRQWDLTKGASKLNEHREEVITLFRDGLALAKIGARYGMSAMGIRNWIKKQGEYDRMISCGLSECDVTFHFSPGKLYCTNKHARRQNARDRASQPGEKEKTRARNKINYRIYKGRLERPTKCERCGKETHKASDGRSLIQADHHHGYDEDHALDIWWLCKACDVLVSRLREEGQQVDREHPHLDQYAPGLCTTQPLTIGKKTLRLDEWAKLNGIRRNTLHRRLTDGWSPEKAATMPTRRYGSNQEHNH